MNNEKKWTEGDVRAEIDRLSAGVEPLVRQLGEVAREIRAVGRPLGIDGTGVLTNLFVEHVVHRHAECVSEILAKSPTEREAIFKRGFKLDEESRVRRLARAFAEAGEAKYAEGLNAYAESFVEPEEDEEEEEGEEEEDEEEEEEEAPDTSTLGPVGSTPDGPALMARVLRDGKLPDIDARELLRRWALSACVSVEHLALLSRLWLGIGRPSVAEDFDRRAAKLKEYPDGGCEHIVGGHCGLESCR